MCDPLSAAGAAASVGSMLMGQQAQNSINSARSAASNAEAARQQALQGEQQKLFGTTLNGVNRASTDQKLADNTQARSDAGQAAVKQGSAGDLPLGDTTQEIRDTINNRYAGSADRQRDLASKYAALAGWGDTNSNNVLDLQRAGYKQGMLGNFSQSSSNILPLELEAANRAGDGAMGASKLLGAAGMAAGLGGALGLGGEPWFKISDLFGKGAALPPPSARIGPGGLVYGGV